MERFQTGILYYEHSGNGNLESSSEIKRTHIPLDWRLVLPVTGLTGGNLLSNQLNKLDISSNDMCARCQ